MKKLFALIVIALFIITGCSKMPSEVPQKDKAAETSGIAIINGEEVPEDYFERQYSIISERFEAYGMEITKRDYLEQAIIPQMVLLQESLAQGYEVTEDEVNEYVDAQMAAINESMGEEQIQAELDSLGMTYDELVEDNKYAYAVQLYINQLLEAEVWPGIEVTDDEVQDYYDNNPDVFEIGEQVNASHILVGTEEEAEDVLARLDEGESFEDLAEELSLDTGSAANGGNLGFFGKGMMVPEFEEAAFDLDVGEVSEPVQTQFGYHIIKVYDKVDGGTLELDDVADQVKQQLLTAKQQAAEETYINQLISKADIEILLPEENESADLTEPIDIVGNVSTE